MNGVGQQQAVKVAIILTDTRISGTARRVGNMFRALSREDSSNYHLITSEEVYEGLNRAGYNLQDYPNVHALKVKSPLDSKKWESKSLTAGDAGRFLTLLNLRNKTLRIINKEHIKVVQCVLDSVYIFGLFPVPRVVQVASLVSVLPHHYDKRALIGRLLHFCLGRYDLIDCVSPRIRDMAVRNGFPAERAFCAPNSFVDVDRYRPEKKNMNEVAFAARLHDFKNPKIYLEAIGAALQDFPDAIFHLLGTGPMREYLTRQLKALGLQGRVHFDFVWETSSILNRSAINVQLQEDDNYPSQSLLEGMASGNAIVATDVGLTRRLVDESNGILIPSPGATGALTESIKWMLGHPTETLDMGARSRERILRENSLGSYLSYMQGLYQEAASLSHSSVESHRSAS